MAAIAALQLLTGLLIVALSNGPGSGDSLVNLIENFHLDATWPFALFDLLGMEERWLIPHLSMSPLPVFVLDLSQLAVGMFVPVLAAYSFGPAREEGGQDAAAASGINALQTFVTAGLAILVPLTGAMTAVQAGWIWCWTRPNSDAVPLGELVVSAVWAVGLLWIRGGLLMCVSALSPGSRTALLRCCLISLLVIPVGYLLFTVPMWFGLMTASWSLVAYLGPIIVEAMIFTLLLPRAVARIDQHLYERMLALEGESAGLAADAAGEDTMSCVAGE